MEDTNKRKVDLLADAGQLLRAFVNGNEIKNLSISELSSGEYKPADEYADSRAVIIASAVLAVAGELRDIHNVLAEINGKMSAGQQMLDDRLTALVGVAQGAY